MNDIEKKLQDVNVWLNDMGLGAIPPSVWATMLVAILALYLALIAIKRSGRPGTEASYQRLNSTFQELSIIVNDAVNRLSSSTATLTRDVEELKILVAGLEDDQALNRHSGQPQTPPPIHARPSESAKNRLTGPAPERATEPPPSTYPPAPEKKTENLAPAHDRSTVLEPAEEIETTFVGGLAKTRSFFLSTLQSVFRRARDNREEFFEALEDALIVSDLGVQASRQLVNELREKSAALPKLDDETLREILKTSIRIILTSEYNPEVSPKQVSGKPRVIAVVGVNGVGKTTTVGKLAARLKGSGARVLLGACDTFRAAAGEQLEVWANRVGVEVVPGGENEKPSTVAYRAIHIGLERDYDVVLIDTAGRLHTRVNLMNELATVLELVAREQPGAPHEVLLVLDATTGQNALQQAREFHHRARLTGLIVTKLDGTPKGGIVVAIRQELGIPIRYIGVGEGIDDLKPFDAKEFVDALFADQNSNAFLQSVSERGQVRRKRREETELN